MFVPSLLFEQLYFVHLLLAGSELLLIVSIQLLRSHLLQQRRLGIHLLRLIKRSELLVQIEFRILNRLQVCGEEVLNFGVKPGLEAILFSLRF